MANQSISRVRLVIKAGGKTYFSTNNINHHASDAALNSLAQAINSVQNLSLNEVIKTADYILTQ